jgi:membrane protein
VPRLPFHLSIGWTELLERTFREFNDDDCLNLAAQLAYYYFLSLFPAVLFLIAFASFFPLSHFTDDIVRMLGPVTPPSVLAFLSEQMRRISDADSGGILTIGILGAIWSSSAALVAIISSLNRAYDLNETRPWWKVRLLAMALTLALAFFVLVSFTLVLAGPTIAERLAATFGLGPVFEWGWKILQWPLVVALVAAGIGLIYYVAPDTRQRWSWIAPGALVATLVWLIASFGFKIYLAQFADYNATYGAVGGVIALLLWFYISGVAILIGAEMNSEIEHASSNGAPAAARQRSSQTDDGATAQPLSAAMSREAQYAGVTERQPGDRVTSTATTQSVASHVHRSSRAADLEEGRVMSDNRHEPTLGEMLAELSNDFKRLIQQELQLARLELSRKATSMRRSAILMVAGGMLAYGGFLAVIAAIVFGIVALGVSYWLASLLTGAGLIVIGYLLIHSSSATMRGGSLAPEHTVETVKEDAQWLKSHTR